MTWWTSSRSSPTIGSSAARTRARTVPTTAAAPAATVIGTMKRRQWSHAAMPAPSPMAAAIRAAVRPAMSGSASARILTGTATTPPTNASSSTIEGRAMRRLRVKNSARPHAAPAISRPATPGAMAAPIPPAAASSSTAAMVTKISLKPVMRRKCSSSAMGALRRPAAWARKASAASWLSAPAATADCRSASVYIGHSPLVIGENAQSVLVCQYSLPVLAGDQPRPPILASAAITACDCSPPDCGTTSPVRSMICSQCAAIPSGVRSSAGRATPGVRVT